MNNLDRRIARLEQTLERTGIDDLVRMTREERAQRMIEILTPYIGEEGARAHVHRLRTDPAYFNEHLEAVKEVAERAGVIPWR